MEKSWNNHGFSLEFLWEPCYIQENTIFELDIGTKFIQIVALYPLHYVTYAPAKFKVATSNGLGDTHLQENTVRLPLWSPLTHIMVCFYWTENLLDSLIVG